MKHISTSDPCCEALKNCEVYTKGLTIKPHKTYHNGMFQIYLMSAHNACLR